MPEIVCVVDPYSTGGMLSVRLSERGYAVVALWTNESGGQEDHVPKECADWIKKKGYLKEVREPKGYLNAQGAAKATADALKQACGGKALAAIICGGESGVKVCDAVAEYLGLRGNTIKYGMDNRRDKSVQQDALAATGVRAVRGVARTVWEGDMEAFIDSETFPVVLKPVESAGSEGVKLCNSKQEAADHFHLLMNSQRAIGGEGAAVIAQEFLRGSEYVCDHVSKDGVHKTMMVWKYDKRLANGSQFVYFGMDPVDPTSRIGQAVIQYTRHAIDAIKIKNGATHSEVMFTKDGPCLVEVNCRCHGGNGTWMPLASMLTGGYNMVTASIDAYLDPKAWDKIPPIPKYPFQGSGKNVMFVSYCEGTVSGTPGYDIIKALPSFSSCNADIKPGDTITKTVDLFGCTGQAILAHTDPEVVAADLKVIRNLESSNKMFTLEGGAEDRFTKVLEPEVRQSVRASTMKEGARSSMADRMAGQKEAAILLAEEIRHAEEVAELHKKYQLAGGICGVAALLGMFMLKK